MDAPVVDAKGPATYEQLKAIRAQYAILILAVLVGSWCLSAFIQIVAVNSQTGQSEPQLSRAALLALAFVPGLCAVAVNVIYAQKVGMLNPVLPATLALFPVLNWIAFFMLVGHTPEHLKEFEPPGDPPPIATWLIVGMLPVLFLGCLGSVRPSYMAQLFLGPPVGAYIPGLPIPCGWPMLGFVLLSLVFTNSSLLLGFQKGLVRGWWKLLLVVLVMIHFVFPSLCLIIFGPATVQLYKRLFGF